MALTIKEALAEKKKGFHIGNRLILPFRCQFIKIIVDGRIYTEFVGGNDIKINQDDKNTSVYFRTVGNLNSMINQYDHAKIIAAEKDTDLCDIKNHIKLICEMKEKHVVDIHEPSEDVLFIE